MFDLRTAVFFWLSSGLSLSPGDGNGGRSGRPSVHPEMCFLPFKSQACYSGQEDIKQKYFLPLPLLLLFCCYSYYYYHHYHHNSVTTISFITMICSFVSPQIHYFLFLFSTNHHPPPTPAKFACIPRDL